MNDREQLTSAHRAEQRLAELLASRVDARRHSGAATETVALLEPLAPHERRRIERAEDCLRRIEEARPARPQATAPITLGSDADHERSTTNLPELLGALHAEMQLRRDRGLPLELEEYIQRVPAFAEPLRELVADAVAADTDVAAGSSPSEMPTAPNPPGATRDACQRSHRLPTITGYEILDEIGRGGMGVVYKARDRQLRRLVAIKMILAGQFARSDSVARFRREAESVARLQHPTSSRSMPPASKTANRISRWSMSTARVWLTCCRLIRSHPFTRRN